MCSRGLAAEGHVHLSRAQWMIFIKGNDDPKGHRNAEVARRQGQGALNLLFIVLLIAYFPFYCFLNKYI